MNGGGTIFSDLEDDPSRFDFDAALRIVQLAAGQATIGRSARLVATAKSAYPTAALLAVLPHADDTELPTLLLGLPALLGANAILPRHYSGYVAEDGGERFLQRPGKKRDGAADARMSGGEQLFRLVNLIGERMFAALGEAGVKYRVARAFEATRHARRQDAPLIERIMLALAGLQGRSAKDGPCGRSGGTPLHYAGLFAHRTHSAAGLAALASDFLGQPVEVVEFQGKWLKIPEDQQTSLAKSWRAGGHSRLGLDSTIGTRVWDPQAGVELRVGPLDLATFSSLLPGEPAMRRFCTIVSDYLGLATSYRVTLVLAARDVPRPRLSSEKKDALRLGLTTWLDNRPRMTRSDACETRVIPETASRPGGQCQHPMPVSPPREPEE